MSTNSPTLELGLDGGAAIPTTLIEVKQGFSDKQTTLLLLKGEVDTKLYQIAEVV